MPGRLPSTVAGSPPSYRGGSRQWPCPSRRGAVPGVDADGDGHDGLPAGRLRGGAAHGEGPADGENPVLPQPEPRGWCCTGAPGAGRRSHRARLAAPIGTSVKRASRASSQRQDIARNAPTAHDAHAQNHRSGALCRRLKDRDTLNMARHRKAVGLSRCCEIPGQSAMSALCLPLHVRRASNERHDDRLVTSPGTGRLPRRGHRARDQPASDKAACAASRISPESGEPLVARDRTSAPNRVQRRTMPSWSSLARKSAKSATPSA